MLIRRAGVAAAVAVVLSLTACSAGRDGSDTSNSGDGSAQGNTSSSDAMPTEGEASQTPDGGPKPYLPVPKGVVLADPGSEHELGESATVAWRLRTHGVGVLAVKVLKLVKANISDLKDWQLNPADRRSSLFYVTLTVANVGESDLSGLRIPLYVLDGAGAFVESSEFKTSFRPCPSPDLPAHFVNGKKVTVCQAYLVPERGTLQAIAFRATQKFNPVRWVGKVSGPQPPKKQDKQG